MLERQGRAVDVIPLTQPAFTTNEHLPAIFVASEIARLPFNPLAVAPTHRRTVDPLKRIVSCTTHAQPQLVSGKPGLFGVMENELVFISGRDDRKMGTKDVAFLLGVLPFSRRLVNELIAFRVELLPWQRTAL